MAPAFGVAHRVSKQRFRTPDRRQRGNAGAWLHVSDGSPQRSKDVRRQRQLAERDDLTSQLVTNPSDYNSRQTTKARAHKQQMREPKRSRQANRASKVAPPENAHRQNTSRAAQGRGQGPTPTHHSLGDCGSTKNNETNEPKDSSSKVNQQSRNEDHRPNTGHPTSKPPAHVTPHSPNPSAVPGTERAGAETTSRRAYRAPTKDRAVYCGRRPFTIH